MFKVKVRPNRHNRYLYDIHLYERANWGMFYYWKWYCTNEAIVDVGIYEALKQIQSKFKVYAIDFLLSQEIEL